MKIKLEINHCYRVTKAIVISWIEIGVKEGDIILLTNYISGRAAFKHLSSGKTVEIYLKSNGVGEGSGIQRVVEL